MGWPFASEWPRIWRLIQEISGSEERLTDEERRSPKGAVLTACEGESSTKRIHWLGYAIQRWLTPDEDLEPEDIPVACEKMTTPKPNELVRVWRRRFAELTWSGIRIRHPTHAESKSIKQSQEVACYGQQKVIPLYVRFSDCDFEGQEGATEFCRHFIRKKIRQPCNMMERLYGPRWAVTPE
jgi:hypothetical protein